ncbi:tetratricopeptide (TPR) repeat protein [Granulicella aggregans]|uniref:Tetratricopeptide (TPR) repeat protein n=1 Tax=Granulicella aggregans TaxID=474949 RepID=A0A7W7ZI06_9BACT|nr:DUF5107 domain-containing protein [Granulicella aggregans]MBB5060309.1 tetratricopeptide (TPR) repeat protein [Granulicella aggregans]
MQDCSSQQSEDRKLQLPPAPASETGAVKAWQQPVSMRTYMHAAPDPNPLFLEKRVYQGSSGRVYPLPVIDRIDTESRPHKWQAVHLENEFIRLMILPEIGGRIHIGLDKLNGYDFFYRQDVIKPALVGLAGPWISGGVEFNWPQHHRPATFMPVEIAIEREPDGAVTVWCSDHDPLSHMKGSHGLRLRPGSACLEVRVRLYNRTADTQTFLWWANVATRVHEQYQSFFPKDVRYAADHAKRALTEYPLSYSTYYGIDYAARAEHGVPDADQPAHFVPDGSYPANDLGWYANIPVPTSYMVVGSKGDFSGGYDHRFDAGLVAVANHHIAPGKKQWTWGNHEFGYAWDRSLTDDNGPYVELMAGVYTDNQPDFSFLAPGETKTFSQFWYPIREIGVPDHANLDAALRVEAGAAELIVHIQVTSARPFSTVRVRVGGIQIATWQGDLEPGAPLHHVFPTNEAADFELIVEQHGDVLLRYAPSGIVPVDAPEVATEPALPDAIATLDELFLTGLHLEQYRHPTRYPESYWQEALRRDPSDSRSAHALGRWHLRRGEFGAAERLLRISIARSTARNPNPYDGEPHYNLGRTLLFLGRTSEAYDAFYKSTWNAAWRSPAYHRLAEIDCSRREWTTALDHISRSLRADTDNLNARDLKTIILRKLHRDDEASLLLSETQALDPLDIFSRYLSIGELPPSGQQRIDLVLDLRRAGLLEESLAITANLVDLPNDGTAAILLYIRADILQQLNRIDESAEAARQAVSASPDYVFPSRLEELVLLQAALVFNPPDARAPYFLANLLYDRKRHVEAIELWERSTSLDPTYSVPWRNLGFGYFNVLHDPARARVAFAKARAIAPADARLLYEQDQLLKRIGEPLEKRLAALIANLGLVSQRDDLTVEIASLYNSLGEPGQALDVLLSRQFQPWEGGEGLALAQYVRANIAIGQQCLSLARPRQALEAFQAANNPPHSLSEARHLLMNHSAIDYWLGVAYSAIGEDAQASTHWQSAANSQGDFQQMQVQSISESTYWKAQALAKLGRTAESHSLFQTIHDYAETLEQQTPTIDYFATSLPAMLLFDEDLKQRQTITARFLKAQALLGLGQRDSAFSLLHEVLSLDLSHVGAIDLLKH